MALGKTIVQELKLDPGVDTLGRWMAHYIAQLIHDAEGATEEKSRREKEALAADAIAKLWAHRSKYENRINPLSELKPVIQVLRSLDPNQNVWIRRFGPRSAKGEAVRHVYDAFRRLVVYLLIRKLSESVDLKASTARAGATSEFHDEQEKAILASLNYWLSEQEVAALNSSSKTEDLDEAEQRTSAQSYVESLLSDARQALDLIAAELTSPPTPPGRAARRGWSTRQRR